jgi:hypothetical protein
VEAICASIFCLKPVINYNTLYIIWLNHFIGISTFISGSSFIMAIKEPDTTAIWLINGAQNIPLYVLIKLSFAGYCRKTYLYTLFLRVYLISLLPVYCRKPPLSYNFIRFLKLYFFYFKQGTIRLRPVKAGWSRL